jgi:hypothetical protein
MEAGQSPLAVRLVERLLPPACREHVIGDLQERAASQGAFLADALRTVPFVLWSQIRRTTDPAMALLMAAGLMMIYRLADRGRSGWLVTAIPAGMAMLVLVLRDAYASEGGRAKIAVAADAFLAMAAALGLGTLAAALQPATAMPQNALLMGTLYGLVLLVVLRTLTSPGSGRVALAGGATAKPEALRQQSDRLWNIFWYAAVLYVVSLFVVLAPHMPPRFTGVATILAIVAGMMGRSYRPRPEPSGEKTSLTLATQVAGLERRRDHMRHWSSHARSGFAVVGGFPLALIALVWITDTALGITAPGPFSLRAAWPVWAPVTAVTAVWFLVGTRLSRRTARALQAEIDALQSPRDDD